MSYNNKFSRFLHEFKQCNNLREIFVNVQKALSKPTVENTLETIPHFVHDKWETNWKDVEFTRIVPTWNIRSEGCELKGPEDNIHVNSADSIQRVDPYR